MGIQIKGSNDTISASDGSMVLEGTALTFDNENITGVSTMATGHITGTTTLDDDLKVGISTLFVDKSAGRVGIGTDNPGTRLTVSDNGPAIVDIHHLDGDTDDEARIILGALRLNPPSNRGAGIAALNNGAGHDLLIKCSASHAAGPTEKVRVTSAGLVGINSTAPSKKLEVQGLDVAFRLKSTVGTGRIGMEFYDTAAQKGFLGYPSSGNDNMSLQQNEAADFYCYVNGADRLRIRADGRVAIASSLAVTGVCTATTFVPTEYQLGNRNILYNGAMQINQYATQVTGLSNYNSYPTCDRWRCIISNGGTYTVEQTDEGPADTGFNHALRFTCTTADNAGQNNLANADGYVAIEQRLEGFDVQGIQKGTTSAKPLAISFWCKSNLTGTYNVEVLDNDNSRRIGSQFTVSSADTWERKTFTFAGDTTGALGNDNGNSLRFTIFLAAGNNFRTGTNSGSWAATTKNQRAENNVSLSKATSNYFALTAVQMEVGDQPTPFEWIKFSEDLRQCQRYYQKIGTGNFGDYSLGTGYVYNNGNNLALGVYLSCPLRASPTVAVTGNMNVRYPAGGSTQVDVNSPSVPSNHDPYCHWLAIGWGITSDIGSNGDLASLNNSNNDGVTISAEL